MRAIRGRREGRVRILTPWLRALLPVFGLVCAGPAFGQLSRPTPVDPRQGERPFDEQEERQRLTRRPVAVPSIARPQAQADTTPLFVLQSLSIEGAIAIPEARFVDLYQPL